MSILSKLKNIEPTLVIIRVNNELGHYVMGKMCTNFTYEKSKFLVVHLSNYLKGRYSVFNISFILSIRTKQNVEGKISICSPHIKVKKKLSKTNIFSKNYVEQLII